MKKFKLALKTSQIADKLKCRSVQVHKRKLDNVAELVEADENSICFYENPKYFEDLRATKAGLIFVHPEFNPEDKTDSDTH